MKDARLEELRFLVELERKGIVTFQGDDFRDRAAHVRVAIHLLAEGLVNDASAMPSGDANEYLNLHPQSLNPYKHRLELERWKAIGLLHQKQRVDVIATHASAVRRAELEQSILRDRLRDPTGILFDARYADRDLSIAVFSASQQEPLVVAYLDLNGLKQLNDRYGHSAGDEAIRVYFEVIAEVVSLVGAAYRLGGDEVMILVENQTLADGVKLLRAILGGLGGHRVQGEPLSAVAGIVEVVDPRESPAAVKDRADRVQYRAKERSKSRPPTRFGALAVDKRDEVEEFEPTADVQFTQTERLALQGIEMILKTVFAALVMPLSLVDAPLWMPLTPDERQLMRDRWTVAVTEKRWELMYMDQIKTESGENISGGRLIEHMVRMFDAIGKTASSVLTRYGSSGGHAIRTIAALEAAAASARNVLIAEGSGNPASPERVTAALVDCFDQMLGALEQCWRREHQSERGICIAFEAKAGTVA